MTIKTAPKAKRASARKQAASVAKSVRSSSSSRNSKVLIKPLHGMEAFELMQSLGIFNAKGKPNPAYR